MTILIPALAVAFAAFWMRRVMRTTGLRGLWGKGLAAVIVLLAVSACCLRYELFALAAAPPASAWQVDHHFFDNVEPLQNIPVVVSNVIHDGYLGVTVTNRGTTTLQYYANGPSDIQILPEVEEHGQWMPGNWGACYSGESDYELAPTREVELRVQFSDGRRERALALIRESGSDRAGLVVLAVEDRQISIDPATLLLTLSTGFTASCIWLTVRIFNRRERWAKWTAAALVGAMLLYPLSVGPAAALLTRQLRAHPAGPEWPLTAYTRAYAPLGALAEIIGAKKLLRAYVEWWAPKNGSGI